MPAVPQYNHKPIKSLYNPKNPDKPASLKQKNYIATICERRKIAAPDLKTLTAAQASQTISNLATVGSSITHLPHPMKCSKCEYVGDSKASLKEHWLIEH